MAPGGKSDGMLIDGDFSNGATWSEGVNEFENVRAHGTLVVGQVVTIVPTITGPLTAAPVALSGYQKVGVVLAAATVGQQVVVQTRGYAEALVDGNTNDVTADDFLEVIAAGTAFTLDHATVRSVNSVGMAVDAQAGATAVLSSVYLIGERVIVAGS